MRRVAVIGSGITGLAAARQLTPHAQVTLFEADDRFGGHAHTVDLTLDGLTHGVDTGFLVFNHRTYPLLTQLFATLGVDTAVSEMSFSVQVRGRGAERGLEWSGNDLNGVFAQRANLLKPRFWGMLADILRFNRLTTAMARCELPQHETLGEFLRREGFGAAFREGYLLPMLGCIWSCPTTQMLEFPLATMVRFCDNHGLLQIRNRPAWYTVRGGSRHYVSRIVDGLADARPATPVRAVRRVGVSGAGTGNSAVEVLSSRGSEIFDDVVIACHSDQALELLADATAAEQQVLGAVRYQPNRAVLHTDASVLPTRRAAWAAWNYDRAEAGDGSARVCLHYLLNRLQPLPWAQPVVLSLNPEAPIAHEHIHGQWSYSHPVFDLGAVRAQRRLPLIQGRWHTWFAGAWCGYGFHEDGLKSATRTVQAMLARWRESPDGATGAPISSPAAAEPRAA